MRILPTLAFTAAACFALSPAFAADAPTLHYWHLYSDAQGVSHFKEETLPFKAAGQPGMAKPPMMAALTGVSSASFAMLSPGQVEEWHKAPSKLFLIVVRGESQVTTGDGTVKEFHVGDIVLMDDTTGKGHITKNPGTTEHVALMVPISSAQ